MSSLIEFPSVHVQRNIRGFFLKKLKFKQNEINKNLSNTEYLYRIVEAIMIRTKASKKVYLKFVHFDAIKDDI